MAKKIVILGGGTGGTLMANRLRKVYDQAELEIAVVDKDDRHIYQPGLLFVPFGLAQRRRDRPTPAPPAPQGHRLPRDGDRPRRSSTTTGCTSPTAPCFPTTS